MALLQVQQHSTALRVRNRNTFTCKRAIYPIIDSDSEKQHYHHKELIEASDGHSILHHDLASARETAEELAAVLLSRIP